LSGLLQRQGDKGRNRKTVEALSLMPVTDEIMHKKAAQARSGWRMEMEKDEMEMQMEM